MAADWFHDAILEGLQRLIVLRLAGAPAATTITAVLNIWVDALWPGRAWHPERDAPRIREAFRRLSAEAEQWPAPRSLLRHLPPEDWGRPYRALPGPAHTPESRARARREIAKMREFLRRSA